MLLERAPEDELQGGEVALEAEPAGEDEPGVVVEERVEVGPADLAGVLGVGEPGPDEHVALPEVVRVRCLEAVEILVVGSARLPRGDPRPHEHPVKRAAPHHAALDEPHLLDDAQEAIERASRHVALEVAEEGDGLLGERVDAALRALLVFEPGKSALPVAAGPGPDGLRGDLEGLPVGSDPRAGSELLEERAALPAMGFEREVGADDLVADEGLGRGDGGHVPQLAGAVRRLRRHFWCDGIGAAGSPIFGQRGTSSPRRVGQIRK